MNVLTNITSYNEIVIQCHDNPDPDAIASGFALYQYLCSIGKNDVKLIYSGHNEITKSNIILLVKYLHIPLIYVTELNKPELLVTVDCQYGAGNVRCFDAFHVATIDHHQIEKNDIEISRIDQNLSSCSTLMWQLLREEQFDFTVHEDAATALYYGLFCDSNNFSELKHPLDKDLRDELLHDGALIRKLKNSNLSINELQIAAAALTSGDNNAAYHYTIFRSEPCDPNILGFISDIALQVDSIDVCVVYSETPVGFKLSIRSSAKEVHADELAIYLTAMIGSGGGHIEKAGGFISQTKLNEICTGSFHTYLKERLYNYFANCDIIYSYKHTLSLTEMAFYKKRRFYLQYVRTIDVWPAGTDITIRTLECDIDITVSDNIYIMIGIKGEVYPIIKDKFLQSYIHCEEQEYQELEYFPTAREKDSGKSISLEPYSRPCISMSESRIWAKRLVRRTKVFTAWDKDHYMNGKIGDYIAIRADDLQDVYIINNDIFDKTYEPVTEDE